MLPCSELTKWSKPQTRAVDGRTAFRSWRGVWQAGESVLLEDGDAEEVIFVVRGRASITRRGVEVSA